MRGLLVCKRDVIYLNDKLMTPSVPRLWDKQTDRSRVPGSQPASSGIRQQDVLTPVGLLYHICSMCVCGYVCLLWSTSTTTTITVQCAVIVRKMTARSKLCRADVLVTVVYLRQRTHILAARMTHRVHIFIVFI